MAISPFHRETSQSLKDVVLEQEVISSLISNCSLIKECYGLLSENDFSDQLTKEIYRELKMMHENNETWDLIILRSKLTDPLKYHHLLYFISSIIGTIHFKKITRIIKELSIKRKIYDLFEQKKISLSEVNVNDIASEVLLFFSNLQSSIRSDNEKMSNIIKKHQILMKDRIDGKIIGIPTGFADLDFSLGQGLQRKDLTIIGARPSVGKTSFSLTLAYNAAKRNQKVLFITLEMDDQEVMDKLLAFESNIPVTAIIRGKVDQENLSSSYTSLSLLSLTIKYLPKASSGEIYSIASQHKYTEGLDLLVIDYLGLLSDEGENETHRLGKITKNLRTFANLLDCAVLVPHQLNRQIERRSEERKTPLLSDLRDSGHVEQDADVIMFLNRETLGTSSLKASLKIAKNRTGETAILDFQFNHLTTKFYQ